MAQASEKTGPVERKLKRILVVEDHTDTAEMLSLVLQTENYKIEWVKTGAAASERLRAPDLPALVMLDLALPDSAGDQIIRQLRSEGIDLPPILIMSARPSDVVEEAARSVGASGIIRKPFDVNTLLEAVDSALIPINDR